MKKSFIALLLLTFACAITTTAEDILLEDWEADFGEWKARLGREGDSPELIRYDIASGTLEVKIPKGSQVTVMREDIELPDDAVKLSIEVTIIGQGFKEVEIGMVIYSATKPLDALGRVKLAEDVKRQVIELPVNAMPHVGSTWNRFGIRIYSPGELKVRLHTLKAIRRDKTTTAPAAKTTDNPPASP